MKIKALKIELLNQLKNIDLDFTYPKGHSKEGQLLEKICFIGQSATGKTQILNLIKDLIVNLFDLEVVGNSLSSKLGKQKKYAAKIILKNDESFYEFDNASKKLSISNLQKTSTKILEFLKSVSGNVSSIDLGNRENVLISFTSDFLSQYNLNFFKMSPSEFTLLNEFYDKDVIIFDDKFNSNFIFSLLKKNLEHKAAYRLKMSELLDNGFGQDVERLIRELNKWNLKNKNPIEDLSDKLSSVFDKLFIELDKTDVKSTIPFKDKRTGDSIPLENLSTGTKSLLLYLIPLFLINQNDSIVLFDEPERSLFPDIQMNLIEYFKELTGDSQLIVATHSPFIAASFEPEERFLLYFDEEGKVIIERGVSPIGDDPNDILKNDFKIDYINSYGKEAFNTYVNLKQKIFNEKNEKNRKELLSEFEKLGDKYNF